MSVWVTNASDNAKTALSTKSIRTSQGGFNLSNSQPILSKIFTKCGFAHRCIRRNVLISRVLLLSSPPDGFCAEPLERSPEIDTFNDIAMDSRNMFNVCTTSLSVKSPETAFTSTPETVA